MRALLYLCAVSVAWGQSFEVASIKPYERPEGGFMRVGTTGGPGTPDPGRWSCEGMSLTNLVSMAYDVPFFQLTAPSWMTEARFNIQAKVPEGASKDDLKVMVKNLLTERFHLKLHRESKEMAMYELVVAKGGPKLKESAGPPPEQPAGLPPPPKPGEAPRFAMGKDGFPELPPGRPGTIMMNGQARHQAVNSGMDALARQLAGQVQKPVVDATGLKGKYDYSIYWSTSSRVAPPPPPGVSGIDALPNTDNSGPTIFTAIQEQLGLKLESKKGPVEIVVVDFAEKTPTEN